MHGLESDASGRDGQAAAAGSLAIRLTALRERRRDERAPLAAVSRDDADSHDARPGCIMVAMDLESLGWNDTFAASLETGAGRGLAPARVAVEHRNGYVLFDVSGTVDAVLAGRFRHRTSTALERPAVGDWVAIESGTGDSPAIIQAVLPRATRFARTAAGRGADAQVVAANVDTVFIVTALDGDLNERRLERYLTLARESGAEPVIILSKGDLAPDADPDLGGIAPNVPVLRVSAHTGAGLEEIRSRIAPGRTIALLGSSGVGKSTLINALLGEARLRTADTRADGRGRHTTTHRELVLLPDGGLLIDTPGMRELQLHAGESDVRGAFDDIAVLAAGCRFADCTHETEPGCAVRAAAADGRLDRDRFDGFRKLLAEARSLEQRTDPAARAERKREDRVMNKALRAHLRRKYE